MKVTLTLEECKIAYATAIDRQADAMRRGLRGKHGADDDLELSIGLHLTGAAGEIAVAKALGVYWAPSVGTFKAPDLGSNVQVRTRTNDSHDLIVRSDDSSSDYFVLVIGRLPVFRIVGWILGADAKREQWVQMHGGRPPAYFIPQSELTPINTPMERIRS